MPNAQSINQNPRQDALPDFRNTGVILRTVLLANGMALLLAAAEADSWGAIALRMADNSTLLEPVLLLVLLLLFALNPALIRLPYRRGAAAVVALAAAATLLVAGLGGELYIPSADYSHFYLARDALLGGTTSGLILGYFRLRLHALSPALAEARLQALRARIRPHFLFNSINAVLSIVRSDPQSAEAALEDMSDMFRAAMAASGDLVPIRQEIALARQYLALEQLRMGDRLKVAWHTEDLPDDALLPPLILQPLLENAVYHGIEPLAGGGTIDIRLYRSGRKILLEMYNPRQEQGSHHTGNKMALNNIRERLDLQFDIEASYTAEAGRDFYRVQVLLPYLKEEAHTASPSASRPA